jgi:hypothetical protein
MRSGIVLLAIGLLAGAVACKARQIAETTTSQASLSSAALSWQDSGRLLYRFSLSSQMQPATEAPTVTLSLEGQLELGVRVAATKSRFLASLTTLSLQAGNQGSTAAPPKLLRELQQPWGFELESGKLFQLRTDKSASASAQNILTTLAAAFQSPPESAQEGSQIARELDGTGRYDAAGSGACDIFRNVASGRGNEVNVG